MDEGIQLDVRDMIAELGTKVEEFLDDFVDGRTKYIAERMASDLFFYVDVDENNKVEFSLILSADDDLGLDEIVGEKELKVKKVLVDHMDSCPEDAEAIINYLKDIIKTQEYRSKS